MFAYQLSRVTIFMYNCWEIQERYVTTNARIRGLAELRRQIHFYVSPVADCQTLISLFRTKKRYIEQELSFED